MNIFFSGIGGVGIGPLALISLDAGYSVQGSDPSRSLMTDELRRRAVAISSDQDGTFLRICHDAAPIDWYVYTAALPDSHPELVTARELGIKVAKRDELLAHIIKDKGLKLIAVAGTHGKTTTTGMLVWTLKQLGVPVSYSVGTTLSWGPSGLYDSESSYFVYECDEFDRNFLKFHPHLSLVTSVEYDHPDTYRTEDDYMHAFSEFIGQSDHTIGWEHDLDQLKFETSSWQLRDDEVLDISVPGLHNRQNATIVKKSIEYLDLNETDNKITLDALMSFPGTNRRFEKLDENLYSDYGHHPSEIAATLQMAREISDTVILVYQPHQNVRQHEIKDQYTDDIFKNASKVYWLATYLSREDPDLEILSAEDLTAHLESTDLAISNLNSELSTSISHHLELGHLVLCMGAGSIDGWLREKYSH